MKRILLSIAAVALCAIAVVLALPRRAPAGSGGAAPRVAYYQDSMHPWIKSIKPGKCTLCGMDLTPVHEGQRGFALATDSVVLAPNSVTVLNVQTDEVKARPLARALKVAGTLEASESRRNVVAAPAMGRIESLHIEFSGAEVTEGQPMLTFYSPTWANQSRRLSFLSRVATPKAGATNMSDAEMLSMQAPAGAPPMNGDAVANDGRTRAGSNFYTELLAPQSGTVIERLVSKGQYVQEGERMFTIVDSSVLWFRFDVYEQQLPWLETGQQIEVTTPSVPGKTFTATISFIEPSINESTRTIRVRADIRNPVVEINGQHRRLLRFGMYADGVVQAVAPVALTVPRDAVLATGADACAYRDNGNGAYERRRLKLGRQGDGFWEVLDGLNAGDRVVTSGNVLIDAQSQFNRGEHSEAPGSNSMPPSPHMMPVHTMSVAPVSNADGGMSVMMDPLCGLAGLTNRLTTGVQTASVVLRTNPVMTTRAVTNALEVTKPATAPNRNKATVDRMGQALAARMKQARSAETGVLSRPLSGGEGRP